MQACRLAHQEDEKGAPFASLPGPSVRSARWVRLKAYRPSSPTFFIGDPAASGLSLTLSSFPTPKSGFPMTHVGNDGFGRGGALVIFFHINDNRQES